VEYISDFLNVAG
jgi:hypothetical protein